MNNKSKRETRVGCTLLQFENRARAHSKKKERGTAAVNQNKTTPRVGRHVWFGSVASIKHPNSSTITHVDTSTDNVVHSQQQVEGSRACCVLERKHTSQNEGMVFH